MSGRWFEDRAITRQLPAPQRAAAVYAHLATRLGIRRGLVRAWRTASKLGHRSATLDIDGLKITPDLSDPSTLTSLDVVRGGDWLHRLMDRYLEPGGTFLDVGANQGVYALLAARVVGPAGSVHAFEPQPPLADSLKRSLAANGFAHGHVHQIAVSDREGELTLNIPSHNTGEASVFDTGGRAIAVRARRIDDELAGVDLSGPVMVKIDVEGSERAALLGSAGLIRQHQPVIVCELLRERQAVVDTLVAVGYEHFANPERPDERVNAAGAVQAPWGDVLALP